MSRLADEVADSDTIISLADGDSSHLNNQGCKIDRVEMRGITIQQLQDIFDDVKKMCKNESLSIDDITIDQFKEKLILKQTEDENCSYVELKARCEQKTTWCVVYRPSQSFKEIFTVLKQHSIDRELDPTDSYWIHVFSDNLRSIPGDINDSFSSLPRAMKLAKGTVCVIDRDCSLLEHLWCLMDIYLAVEKKKIDNNYKLDFYTRHNESAVGLTDGFINEDSNDLAKKLKRESNFSIKLVEKALQVNVGNLDFDEKEKFYERFLKNAITGIPRNDKVDRTHENYGIFNKALKGIFVCASLDLLLKKNSAKLQDCIEILNTYKPKIISLDLSEVEVDVIKKLFESLPSSIKEIYINLDGKQIGDVVAKKMYIFLGNLDQLDVLNIRGVYLDFTDLISYSSKHYSTIRSLTLVKCYISDQNVEQLISIIQQCPKLVELNLSGNRDLKYGLRKIDKMLEKNHLITKLRLFQTADNDETIKPCHLYSLKNIKPYHFSSDDLYEVDKHYYERRDGCTIERAENRGITINQLLFVVQEMEVLYNRDKELWMKKGKKIEEVTINDIFEKIIKPRTKEKKASYVEIVASEEQRPSWCVCFIWAQPLKDMVDILLKHSKDRDMRDSDSYWINVFSNNPWNIAGDINDFYSSLPRAMSITIGHVLVIDDKFVILRRLWCVYDIYLAIDKRRKKDYKIDFYTFYKEEKQRFVAGITDGLISTDSKHNSTAEASFSKKFEREKNFPFDFFKSALQFKNKDAQTNDEMDKEFLRKAIFNSKLSDEKFDYVVAGFFIASSLHRLIVKGDQLDEYFKVLENSLSTEIRLDLVNCKTFNQQQANELYKSVPLSLQTFYIKMEFTNIDDGIECKLKEYISKFKNIKELTMDGAKLNSESLTQIFSDCKELEKLCLIKCGLTNQNLKVLFKALNGNKILTELNLSNNGLKITSNEIFDILKKTEIKKMNLKHNVVDKHILLNFNKRFRTMHITANEYQTPNTSDFLIDEDTSILISDGRKGGVDRLGFKVYAEAIKNALVLATIPICAGIYAKWGSGKTFLLELIRKEFDSNTAENTTKDGLVQWFQEEWVQPKSGDDINIPDDIKEEKHFVSKKCKDFSETCSSVLTYFFYNYTIATILNIFFEYLLGCNVERKQSAPTNSDVEKKIEREYVFVTFNALEYAESDELYAGLIRILYKMTELRLSQHDSEAYFKAYSYKQKRNFRENYLRKWRIKKAKELLLEQFGGREELRASLVAAILLIIGIIVCIILNSIGLINFKDLITWSTNTYESIATYVGFIVTAIPSIQLLYGANRSSVISRGEDIYQQASDQNVRDKIGFLNKVINELRDLFEFMKQYRDETDIELTLVLFVDDLDQSLNRRVVNVLEVIRLLLSIPSAPVIVFLAMDTGVVVPGIENFINNSLGVSDSLTTGWSYLEKIVQLPFYLPEPLPHFLKEFITISVRKNIIDLKERVKKRLNEMIDRIRIVQDTIRLDNMDRELTYFVTDSHQHKKTFNFEKLRIEVTNDKIIESAANELLGKDVYESIKNEKNQEKENELMENMLFHLLETFDSVSIERIEKIQTVDCHTSENDDSRIFRGSSSTNIVFSTKLICEAQNKLQNLKTDDFSLPGHIRALLSSLSDFIDKNPRKIKRIINMVLLIFEVGKRKAIKVGETNRIMFGLDSWKILSRKLVLWVVLCEFYPYRMSMLVNRLICKYRANDINLVNSIDDMKVSEFYCSHVQYYINKIASGKKLQRIDGNPDEFNRLISYDVGFSSFVEEFLFCKDVLGVHVNEKNERLVERSIIANSFCLDPSIREQISVEINQLITDEEPISVGFNYSCDKIVSPSDRLGSRKNKLDRIRNNSMNGDSSGSQIFTCKYPNYGSTSVY